MELLVLFLENIFNYLFLLTGNYGISLILLSMLVNIILLPAYIPLENWKKKTLTKQSGMNREVEEIKKYYKGQERYLYIQAIYRRHKFHPIQSLTMSLGLFIQIPFFIAAYRLLSHFPGFDGVSFLFISDLAMADNYSSLGTLPVNILPIAMTMINALSTYLYTREDKNKSGRYQLYFIALVFLILLYTSPAALVLYWTMNNVFALIKQVIHNKFQILKELDFHKFLSSYKRNDFYIFAGLLFFAAYLLLSFKSYRFMDIKTPVHLFLSFFVLTVFAQIVGYLNYSINWKKTLKNNILLLSASSLFVLQLWVIVSLFIELYQPGIIVKNYAMEIYFLMILTGLNTLLPIKAMLSKYIRIRLSVQPTGDDFYGSFRIFIPAVSLLTLSIFFWLPALIYNSMPSSFNFSLLKLFISNGIYVLIVLVILLLTYRFFPKKLRNHITLFSFYAALTGFVFAYLIPFDFGSLEGFTITLTDNLGSDYKYYIMEFILILFIFFFCRYLYIKHKKKIANILVLLNILVIIQTFSTISIDENKKSMSNNLPENIHKVLSFSKTEENVVIFMLDAFRGGYIHQILKENPELRQRLDGFTWFPNTLSISYLTNSSLPSMIGGMDYTPDKINKMGDQTLFEKTAMAYDNLLELTAEKNYKLSIVDPVYYKSFQGKSDLIDKRILTTSVSYFGSYWKEKHEDIIFSNTRQIASTLASIGIFRLVPLSFKNQVYNNGGWLNNYRSGYDFAKDGWGFLKLLPELSNYDEESKTYKFFNIGLTHRPYAVTADGKLLQSGYPDPSSPDGIGGKNPFYSAKWSLILIADWIDWLKENEIYNNTKIIIVSDHGNQHTLTYKTEFQNIDLIENLFISEMDLNRLHPLLMVKDFNKAGELKTDHTLMSNADTMNIALNLKSPLNSDEERTLRSYRTLTWRKRELERLSKYDFNIVFEVDDSMLDLKNWKVVYRE